ncbi:NWD NACHT-NTPase, N-terminal [Fusarium oxysporum f. sp. vasinfectum]|nr:NWD NACHT-NTPase, N-terminal [Fusarium oxysporum f. sp. vasinfectum]
MPVVLSNPSADNLWATAVGKLDKELRDNIDFDNEKIEAASEVLKLTVKAQKECDDKAWRFRRKDGATVSVRDVLTKIVKWVEHFVVIGDTVVQYDPGHAALPWAGVRFLLQIMIGDFQAYKFMLESIESLSELLCYYACVEDILLQFSKAPKNGPSASDATQKLRDALVQLYVNVLTYLARARKYFQTYTAKRVLKSAFLQASDLEETFGVIAESRRKVDNYFDLVYKKEKLNGQQRVEKLMLDFQAPLLRWSDDLTRVTDHLDKTKRTKILKWLSKEPYRKHHQLVKEDLIEGTGQWLLSDPIYRRWKKDSASSILWLHGIPGSGKSKLVSVVVENAIEAFEQREQPPPVYFYCSRSPAEPARADPEAILASIARQLSCLEPGQALFQPTIEVYNTHEEEGFAAESLRLHETRQLIMRLSENYPTITIILDALDECNPATRDSLMATMELVLQDSPCLVKMFVSSRDDQDIVYRLRHYPNLELSSQKNAGDIDKFVKLETCRLINSGKLLRYSSAQDRLRQEIMERITCDAQGMFRWASLQLEALCELKSDQAIMERLGRLPPTLEDLYQEVFQKIKNYPSGSDREYAKHVFSWLLCAKRRLSPAELISAVSMAAPHQQLQTEQILDFCCNLVVLDTQLDTFRFAHLSVREFLESQDGYASTFSNALAAKSCLLTVFGLAKDRFSKDVLLKLGYGNEIGNTDLMDYSFLYWTVHCQAAANRRNEGQFRELLQCFMQAERESESVVWRWNSYLQRMLSDRDIDHMSKLRPCCAVSGSWAFIACAFNIFEFLEWGKEYAIGQLRNEDNQTCEEVAAAAGSIDALQRLLIINSPRVTYSVVKAAASNEGNGKEVMTLLLDRLGDQVPVTESVVKAAVGNRRSGKDIMTLLLDRLGDQVLVVDGVVSLIAEFFDEEVMRLLLDRFGDKIPFTESVFKAVAGNWRSGEEVMILLLDRFGDQVPVTESVVEAAAGNTGHAKEIMALLLDRFGDQVLVTESVVEAAAENWISGKEIMTLLLDRLGDQVPLTESVVKAVARNMRCGKDIMTLLLDRLGDQVLVVDGVVSLIAEFFDEKMMALFLDRLGDQLLVTESVVEAAAENWMSGKDIMILLLDRLGDRLLVTESVVKAVAGNWESDREVMALFLDRLGDQVLVTESVVEAAAGNIGTGKEVMALLLDRFGDKIPVTENVFKTAAGNTASGKEVMALLLDRFGDKIPLTESVFKAAAGNEESGGEVMMLLLDRLGDQVPLTEIVVEAAAGNRRSGEEIMTLLLHHLGDKIPLTESVVKTAAGNKASGEKMMILLLDRLGNQVLVVDGVIPLIAEFFDEKVMALFLDRFGDKIPVTESVVEAAAGNIGTGKEVMALLLDRFGDKIPVTESVFKTAAGNTASGKEVMALLLDRFGDQVLVTESVVEAAAGNEESGGGGNDASSGPIWRPGPVDGKRG